MDDDLDLDALRASFRDVLASECSLEVALKHFEHRHGTHRKLWDTIVELGWPALAIPEAQGGLGLGIAALALLYEELGRAVAPLPFASTMIAADAIARGGSEQQRDVWLPRIAAGAILAVAPPAPLGPPQLRIERQGAAWHLSGSVDVLDAADAAAALLLASDMNGGLCRVLVAPAMVAARSLWDHGHTLSTLTFDREDVGEDAVFASGVELEEALAIHAALALAAEAVGGSDTLLPLTVDYLKTRHQFGKPIGSFQGLKHRVADHRTRLEADRLLLASAVALAAAGDPLAGSEASAAKAQACADYAELARDAVQLHGGIGFTSEQACHLFLKRARLNEALFGDGERHIARAAAALGLEIAA